MNLEDLVQKKCLPEADSNSPIRTAEAGEYLKALGHEWRLSEDGRAILAEYRMADFEAAIALINQIAQLAESEHHHPDLHLTGYRSLTVRLSTHEIDGLSRNDFILAAKIAALPKRT